MRRILTLLLAVVMIFVCTVGVTAANIGDIVNKTVYTDIVAKINGQDIASYNVDGYTVVVAEDLRQYGFNVVWSAEERALYITASENNPAVTSTYTSPKISANKVGKKAFDVLYSDIKTFINGELVTSYNIGGKTVIYFNDLSRFGSISYDDSVRTLTGQFSWLKGPAVWYSSSMYRVGTDIPAGDYYAVVTTEYGGYYCKYKDSSQKDIEDNDGFEKFTFFRCYDGQYLKLSRCKITSIENAPINKTPDNVYGEGTYRIGIDMPAGEYKMVVTSSEYGGYYCAYTDITYDDIENNDGFEDVTYYTFKSGQYVKLSRCKAFLINETPENNDTANGEIKMYDEFPEVPDFGSFANISPINTSGGLFTYRATEAVRSKGSNVWLEYAQLLLDTGFECPLINRLNTAWHFKKPGIEVIFWTPVEGYDRIDISIKRN